MTSGGLTPRQPLQCNDCVCVCVCVSVGCLLIIIKAMMLIFGSVVEREWCCVVLCCVVLCCVVLCCVALLCVCDIFYTCCDAVAVTACRSEPGQSCCENKKWKPGIRLDHVWSRWEQHFSHQTINNSKSSAHIYIPKEWRMIRVSGPMTGWTCCTVRASSQYRPICHQLYSTTLWDKQLNRLVMEQLNHSRITVEPQKATNTT